MATIRKRGPSRWEAQVRRRGWPTRTSTFHTKADAQCWAADIESAMHKRSYSDDPALKTTTVRALLQRYLDDETPKKKGFESESCRLKAFMREAFADLTLSEINSNAIAAWRDARLKVVAPATVKRDLIVLSHVFTLATTEWDFEMDNPLEKVRRPSSAPHRKRMPTWSEKKRLLRKLTTSVHDMRHAAATNLSKKLSNVLELSAVTGHKSLQMLKIYYQPDPTEMAKRLDA